MPYGVMGSWMQVRSGTQSRGACTRGLLMTVVPGSFARFVARMCPLQPQGHVQVFYNMIKFGMDPQQALDVPRICFAAGAPDGQILLEEGLEHLVPELVARGHTNIKVVTGIPARLYGQRGWGGL